MVWGSVPPCEHREGAGLLRACFQTSVITAELLSAKILDLAEVPYQVKVNLALKDPK